MKKQNKNATLLTILTLSALLTISCSGGADGKEEAKSMDTIHMEEGIPVVTRNIDSQGFSTYLEFTSSLKGISESTKSAMVSDTVDSVKAKVGDYVKKDQVIVTFPKDNPAASYEQARVGYLAAEKAFARITKLYEGKGISRQQYDDTKTQFDIAKANWNNANSIIQVKSPLSGFITRLNVQRTDNVTPGTALFTVSNYNKLKTTLMVADHEISFIKKGQKAIAEWEDRKLEGVITQVDLSVNEETRAFSVTAEFNNKDHSVPSGITGDISIETNHIPDTLVLHRSEMIKQGSQWFCYLAMGDKSVKSEIKPGLRQGLVYQITDGIQAGDKVIIQGVSQVRDGGKIKIISQSGSDASVKLATIKE